jgi:cytochrome c oxidase subunit II
MSKKLTILAAMVALVAWSYDASDSLAGDTSAGEESYRACAACHGAQGEGVRAMHAPAIAGQEAFYLEKQLQDFRSGVRGTSPRDTFGKQMSPSAHALPDAAAVANVSAYAASLPRPTASADPTGVGDPTAASGNAALGRNLYGSCVACHGANAEGNRALSAPRLDLLQDWYVVGELRDFKDGLRGTSYESHTGPVMTPIDDILPDEAAMRDVAAYISTL